MAHFVSFRSTGGCKASHVLEEGDVGRFSPNEIKGPVTCAAVGCLVDCLPLDRGSYVAISHRHKCTVSSLHVRRLNVWLQTKLSTIRVARTESCARCHRSLGYMSKRQWRYTVHLDGVAAAIDLVHLRTRLVVVFSKTVSVDRYMKKPTPFPPTRHTVFTFAAFDTIPVIQPGVLKPGKRMCSDCSGSFGSTVACVFTKKCNVCNQLFSARAASEATCVDMPRGSTVVWTFEDLRQIHVIQADNRFVRLAHQEKCPCDWSLFRWRVKGMSKVPTLEDGTFEQSCCRACLVPHPTSQDPSLIDEPELEFDFSTCDIMDFPLEDTGQCFVCEMVLPNESLKHFDVIPSRRLFESVKRYYTTYAVCVRCLTSCNRCGQPALKEPDDKSLCDECFLFETIPVVPLCRPPETQLFKLYK